MHIFKEWSLRQIRWLALLPKKFSYKIMESLPFVMCIFFCQCGKLDKVRALLAGGADPCVPNSEGKLALELASDEMRTVFNEELLQATAQSKSVEGR